MIFTHGTIITMNPDREIIDDGAVVVSGDRIEAVGKTRELRARYRSADEIDLSGHIVLPGLVDTHVHLAQTMLRRRVGGQAAGRLLELAVRSHLPVAGLLHGGRRPRPAPAWPYWR